MNKILKFLFLGLILWGSAEIFSGITIDGYLWAIITAAVIAIVNVWIKPILQFVTFPITLVTFGLFLLVINACMIEIADWLLSGFNVDGFWWALLLSFVISIANSFVTRLESKPA